jgi:hypothetical protein
MYRNLNWRKGFAAIPIGLALAWVAESGRAQSGPVVRALSPTDIRTERDHQSAPAPIDVQNEDFPN